MARQYRFEPPSEMKTVARQYRFEPPTAARQYRFEPPSEMKTVARQYRFEPPFHQRFLCTDVSIASSLQQRCSRLQKKLQHQHRFGVSTTEAPRSAGTQHNTTEAQKRARTQHNRSPRTSRTHHNTRTSPTKGKNTTCKFRVTRLYWSCA